MGKVGGDIAGDEDAHVATEPGVDRDVLLSVGADIRDRVADDAGPELEPPELLAGVGIDSLEPSVERAVEDDIAGSHERATPHGVRLANSPALATGGDVERHELAAVAVGTGVLGRAGSDVRRARDVGGGARLEIHAQVDRRDVKQPGPRGERRRLLVLSPLETGADVGDLLPLRGGLVGYHLRPAGR